MKHGIELNGLANIKIILDSDDCNFTVTMNTDDGETPAYCIPIERIETVRKQLDLLERYMIAYCNAINKGEQPPQWHDVRNNPNQYLTNRERCG